MTKTGLDLCRAGTAAALLSLCLASPLLAQRADRATISGVVTDGQGSPIPGAAVTISNQATGVNTVLVQKIRLKWVIPINA